MEIQHPIAGLIVLVGSVAFLKIIDFLAAQSVKRLLEMGIIYKVIPAYAGRNTGRFYSWSYCTAPSLAVALPSFTMNSP